MEPHTIIALAAAAALSLALRELLRLRAAVATAIRSALTDELTGIGNKRAWNERTQRLMAAGRPFSFVLFDVANLKAMNTALGHEHADAVLRELAREVRAGELVGDRIGGDEFALVIEGGDLEAAEAARDRIEVTVGEREVAAGVLVFMVGEVGSWTPGAELHERLTAADFELERRKAGRKSSLGLPLTREETLALLPSA